MAGVDRIKAASKYADAGSQTTVLFTPADRPRQAALRLAKPAIHSLVFALLRFEPVRARFSSKKTEAFTLAQEK